MKNAPQVKVLAASRTPSLAFCVFMDLVGCLSFLLPFLGEAFDLIWAPVSAFIFLKTFGGRVGKMGAVLTFVEELLPFSDFIPSFTIAYFLKKKFGRWLH